VTLAAYTGHEALTFPDYLDLGTGKTLAAEPGGTYDVAPASGRLVPDTPTGWFTRAGDGGGDPGGEAGEGAPAEGDGAPGPGGEEAGGEPGDENEHSAF
jgi:hypothetical protein